MCTQAVGLIAAEIERRDIPTACIVLLREVAVKVRPPRALAVPWPHGFPLGKAGDADGQRRVLETALGLIGDPGPPPVLRDYAR